MFMRTTVGLALLVTLATTTLAADPPTPQDSETFKRLVQEEVRRQLPAAVKAEVTAQVDEVVRKARSEAALASRLNSAVSTLQTLRGELELYKIQHADQFPTMANFVTWNAFLEKTDVHGQVTEKGTLGPYLQSPPVNPFTGKSDVVAAGKASMAAGWTWNEGTCELLLIMPESERDIIRAAPRGLIEVATGKTVAAASPESQRANSLASVLQTVRGQLELYKIQHNDKFPPFADLAGWKVLLTTTNARGDMGPGLPFGPYMRGAPVNVITGKSAIAPAGSGAPNAGWTYDEKTGVVRAVLPADAPESLTSAVGKTNFEFAKDNAHPTPVTNAESPGPGSLP